MLVLRTLSLLYRGCLFAGIEDAEPFVQSSLVCWYRVYSAFCTDDACLLVYRTLSLKYRGCLFVGVDDTYPFVQRMFVCW